MHTKKYIDNLCKNAIYGNPFIQLTAEDVQNCKLSFIKNKHNTPKEDFNKLKEDYNTYYKDFKTSLDDKTPKDVTMNKADKTYNKNNSSMDDEPAEKIQKVDTNRIDVLKLVIYRDDKTKKFKSRFKSSLKTNNENVTSSTEEVSMEEPIESEKSSEKNVRSMIRVVDLRKIMDEDNYKIWMKNVGIEPKHLRTDIKKLTAAKLSTTRYQPFLHNYKVNGVKHTLNGENLVRRNLIEIKKLYKKYFIKCVRDTIVIIANILNIILMSEKYCKARIYISSKKKNEALKLKERYDARKLNERHKKILVKKLKNNLICVISSFEESEFDLAFKMIFISILTVLQVLDKPNFKKGRIFKKLVLLLLNSLKASEYNHPQMFSLLRAKTFEHDCIDLIKLIEDNRDIDSGVTDWMSWFFVSAENNLKFFQAVIDAVTSDSKEELELLIDNATFQCFNNSMFKDPVDSTNVTETNQSTNNSDEIIQDGTYQHIPLLNDNTSQTIANTAVKQSNVMSQSFSSQLQKKPYVSSTSHKIPTNQCFGVMPINSLSPLVQATCKMKAVVNGYDDKPEPTVSNNVVVNQEPAVFIKCHSRNCNNLLCGNKLVKYCSNNCQVIDTYDLYAWIVNVKQ